MPYSHVNELADHLTFTSDARWSNRNPIRAGIFLTRVNRAQNEYLQLQYNAIYPGNLSELSHEIPISAPPRPSVNAGNTTADILRILFQPQLNYFPSEVNINTATEGRMLLMEIHHWYTPEDLNSKPLVSQPHLTKLAHWETLAKNSNSTSFSQFLSKLRACDVVTHSSEFKQHIRTFLDNIVLSPSLAETLFAIAYDGTASCNDKTLFTYNQMQQVMIVDDINKGKYDNQLDALITIARRVYRTRQLTIMANQHMKRHPNTDEVEVYLGFQTRLHSALDLQHFAPDMHSFICSKISAEDLISAEKTIKKNENIQFPAWLAQWEPLHALIERLAPEKIRAAQEKRYHMLEFEYQKNVDDLLRKNILKNIPDAEINAGKIVLKKMQLEIDRALIADFFSQHQLNSAIENEFWSKDNYSKA
ncbi:NEL-type E3 ubiquitin ligase domain-containing protein [Candidatus Symbiopectobacterium sp. NZEC151]|uniref:NEL-type E3 ubiquitin ligase domain-containing protein n=2 Tax=unclassified Symbiopectobacterium TaxID=2794573 RepID=UPI002227BF34|nr:NEL-type E3 ubiquitin ligase domain-containing protein [Candidatus Symbiopectobacterium sp. NZEC151]MCW2473139.1 hypothetical protein [Candidatus Symbiopectobacterium sp. NZEC151]